MGEWEHEAWLAGVSAGTRSSSMRLSVRGMWTMRHGEGPSVGVTPLSPFSANSAWSKPISRGKYSVHPSRIQMANDVISQWCVSRRTHSSDWALRAHGYTLSFLLPRPALTIRNSGPWPWRSPERTSCGEAGLSSVLCDVLPLHKKGIKFPKSFTVEILQAGFLRLGKGELFILP